MKEADLNTRHCLIPTTRHPGKHRTIVTTLWPPDAKSQLIGKDPDAGKEPREEEKGTTENEMVG